MSCGVSGSIPFAAMGTRPAVYLGDSSQQMLKLASSSTIVYSYINMYLLQEILHILLYLMLTKPVFNRYGIRILRLESLLILLICGEASPKTYSVKTGLLPIKFFTEKPTKSRLAKRNSK